METRDVAPFKSEQLLEDFVAFRASPSFFAESENFGEQRTNVGGRRGSSNRQTQKERKHYEARMRAVSSQTVALLERMQLILNAADVTRDELHRLASGSCPLPPALENWLLSPE
jgi:hypothetical protein